MNVGILDAPLVSEILAISLQFFSVHSSDQIIYIDKF